jgi:hypothetical protein
MAKSCWASTKIGFTKYITNYEQLNAYHLNKTTSLNIRNNRHVGTHDNKQVLINSTIITSFDSSGDTNSQVDGLHWQVSLTPEYRLS